jgi:hypothetical protein
MYRSHSSDINAESLIYYKRVIAKELIIYLKETLKKQNGELAIVASQLYIWTRFYIIYSLLYNYNKGDSAHGR